MDRRSFLRGVLAATTAAVLPSMRTEPLVVESTLAPLLPSQDMILTLADIEAMRAEIYRVCGPTKELFSVFVSPKTAHELRRRALLDVVNGRESFGGARLVVANGP